MVLETRTDRIGGLAYRVRRDGADVIGWSPVGLRLVGEDSPVAPEVLSVERGTGSSAEATRTAAARPPRRYASLVIHTRVRSRRLDWELRAYDDGVAFRLILPFQPGLARARIRRETTGFVFPADYRCLGVRQTRFANSHEGDYAPVRASAIGRGMLYDLPLVCRTGIGEGTLALSESGIDIYAAAYLTGMAGRTGVAIKLTPRPDDPGVAVSTAIPRRGLATPWRVVLVADRPERLLESTLVADVAARSRIADSRWIRPGKAAWGWWSGLLATGVAAPGHNDATYRYYIDFAARFGLPYVLVDRGWAWRNGGQGSADPKVDITRSAPGVNIPGLVAYARARGVRLWLWVNWKRLDPQLDRVLALYQRVGIAGIKVDYVYRQDQQAVAFYHRLLASAARHRLMVNVHAAFVPRGLDRTWPNFVTQEGVEGAEYNRWSRKVTATHNVRLAYTRAIIGPMDYAPGGFRNVGPARFEPKSTAPEVMTTRAQQLGLFVAYPSPLTSLADAPSAYEQKDGTLAPGADLVRRVPTTWDETRGLAGGFGHWIAVARRKGQNWYVGVLNDEQARDVAIPLGVLGRDEWRVESWTDGSTPDRVVRRRGRVSGRGNLIVPLASGGGAALVLRPVSSVQR